MTSAIIRFGVNPPAPEESKPARVIAGAPVNTTLNYYTDPDSRFFSGEWRSTPGKWAVSYTEDELVVILEGRCTLTSEAGVAETFGPGDTFVIPRGFEGTWETLEPLRKIYAIYAPPSGS
jgi:uncharacterized cupin superfamily protein